MRGEGDIVTTRLNASAQMRFRVIDGGIFIETEGQAGAVGGR